MIHKIKAMYDGGRGSSMREVRIGGVASPVYFVVFVLSFSRLMYVGTSRRPIDTETFIRLHDAAFRYFGGCPEECVYFFHIERPMNRPLRRLIELGLLYLPIADLQLESPQSWQTMPQQVPQKCQLSTWLFLYGSS